MALGYSLSYLLLLFSEFAGIQNAAGQLTAAASELDDEPKFMDKALSLFHGIEDMLPAKIIVITDFISNPVGLRFCQQIQENAKAEAFLHELPESNHNVIETYYGKIDSIFFLLNSNAHPRTNLRFKLVKDLLLESGNSVTEFGLQDNSVSSLLECIYTLDWVSLLIADHKEVNSTLIKNINALKEYLSVN